MEDMTLNRISNSHTIWFSIMVGNGNNRISMTEIFFKNEGVSSHNLVTSYDCFAYQIPPFVTTSYENVWKFRFAARIVLKCKNTRERRSGNNLNQILVSGIFHLRNNYHGLIRLVNKILIWLSSPNKHREEHGNF